MYNEVVDVKEKEHLRFIDFCSGIGGGRLGLELLGLKCVAHSEINADSDLTYKIFYGDENNLGDLTKISSSKIPESDILIAGFPCQTFSIAGKRAGMEDDRGQIINYIANILREKKIPYFILENVKGLVNHDKGKTYKKILDLLESSGYKVFNKVLNSADYGVPQLRERVYFVGIRKDLCKKPFEFPKTKSPVNIKSCLLDSNKEKLDLSHVTFQKYLKNKYNNGRVSLDEILQKNFAIIDTRQSDLRLYEDKCPTLRTGRHGILYVRDGELYKLSGIEALLIQGFPLKLAKKVKDLPNSKILSQAGNAMTVNVIKAIGEKLLEYVEED